MSDRKPTQKAEAIPVPKQVVPPIPMQMAPSQSYIPTQPQPVMMSPYGMSPMSRAENEDPLTLDAAKEKQLLSSMSKTPSAVTQVPLEDPSLPHYFRG